jgi:hypothetical protein
MADKKKTRVVQLDIELATGSGTTYTRAEDDLDSMQLTDTNVVMLFNSRGDMIAMYSPMLWVHVASKFEDIA